jgi:hypothetical protein
VAEMSETKTATEMCLSRLVEAFDARTGARVQELLDSLYKDGYTQQQIIDALRKTFPKPEVS